MLGKMLGCGAGRGVCLPGDPYSESSRRDSVGRRCSGTIRPSSKGPSGVVPSGFLAALVSGQSFRGGGVEGRITKLSGKTSLDESVFWGSLWGATRLEVTVSSDPPAPAHPIPTLGEWGLLAMNLLLALGGWASLRRKRA